MLKCVDHEHCWVGAEHPNKFYEPAEFETKHELANHLA